MFFTKNLYNMIFVIYVIICLLLLAYHYTKERKELFSTNNTNNDINDTINDTIKENTFYVLFNGNLETTYRLCEMLILEGKRVQPLYLHMNFNCDSTPSNNNCGVSSMVLINRTQEYEKRIIDKIISKIKNDYPDVEKHGLLLPIKDIRDEIEKYKINEDTEYMKYINKLLKVNNYKFIIKNKVLQKYYYMIIKFCHYNNIFIDIVLSPIENKEKNLLKILNSKLIQIEQQRRGLNKKTITAINNQLDISNNEEHFLSLMRFPLYKKSKNNMLKSQFANILQLNWSCINPSSINGLPCGKCNKCLMILNTTTSK